MTTRTVLEKFADVNNWVWRDTIGWVWHDYHEVPWQLAATSLEEKEEIVGAMERAGVNGAELIQIMDENFDEILAVWEELALKDEGATLKMATEEWLRRKEVSK